MDEEWELSYFVVPSQFKQDSDTTNFFVQCIPSADWK